MGSELSLADTFKWEQKELKLQIEALKMAVPKTLTAAAVGSGDSTAVAVGLGGSIATAKAKKSKKSKTVIKVLEEVDEKYDEEEENDEDFTGRKCVDGVWMTGTFTNGNFTPDVESSADTSSGEDTK